MEIQYFGANCVKLTTKKASVIVDDNLGELGKGSVAKADDIVVLTSREIKPKVSDKQLIIDIPGEYEASGVSIQGVAARAHTDKAGQKSSTIFKLIMDDVSVLVTGNIWPELSDLQVETLGTVDVMLIPVGGFGLTMDSTEALKVIKKFEPRIIIPTHYADKAIKYPVPQQSLEEALKGLAMEPKETVVKLKLKSSDLPELTEVIVLERQ